MLPWLVGATVFAFAGGSSSVSTVTRVCHGARWVLLVLLLGVAAARAVAARRPLRTIAPAVVASAFVGLDLVSAGWSVAPRLTVERTISVGILFATALLLAVAEDRPARLLSGLVGGAAAVGVVGLVLLGVDHGAAVQAASIESPLRFRGFGMNANTAALLFALALPLAVALAQAAVRTSTRAAYVAAAALFAGSIVASGSRGALFAGGAGALIAAAAGRRTLRGASAAAAVVVAAVGICLALQNVPQAPTHMSPASVPPQPAQLRPRPGYLNAEAAYPLSRDVGAPLPGGGQPALKRGVLGGSGRLGAWIGALHQVLQRPLLGFGFGTEAQVFVNRYYYFRGGSPENSYLGIALQLGLVGLLVLLLLFSATLTSVRVAVAGRERAAALACAGAVTAGLVLAIVQSYVYSVGDIGTSTFWIAAFLLPALAAEARRA